MSKYKHYFFGWLDANPNFYTKPMPSKLLDTHLVANPKLRESILRSKSARAQYLNIEQRISVDYATIINVQLNNAFQEMGLIDLSEPIKSDSNTSQAIKNYLYIREKLERFISSDIQGHKNREAQRHAFTRWIHIAEILLQHHNYEGFSFLTLHLSQLDTKCLFSKDQKHHQQRKLELFIQVLSPFNNFKELRTRLTLTENQKPNNFIPFFLLSKDMSFFNEVLGEFKDTPSHSLSKDHPLYEVICNKEKLLLKVLRAKPEEKRTLPNHLQITFDHLSAVKDVEMEEGPVNRV